MKSPIWDLTDEELIGIIYREKHRELIRVNEDENICRNNIAVKIFELTEKGVPEEEIEKIKALLEKKRLRGLDKYADAFAQEHNELAEELGILEFLNKGKKQEEEHI